jgi:hypothetical protein
MEQKDFLALVLLLACASGGLLVACLSSRARDLLFVMLVFLSVVTERVDVNFVSRDWYRGSTRGFEVSLVDVISLCLLLSTVLVPRPGQRRFFWPASFGFMLLFFAYASFCTVIAEPKLFPLFELSKMIRGMTIFVATALFVRGERELRLLILGLGIAVVYQGLLALTQRYIYGIHRVFATVDDSNSLSMYFCMTAPIFVAALNSQFPKFLRLLSFAAVGAACVGVVLTISRAGVVTMASVLFATTVATISYSVTPRKIAMLLFVALAVAAITIKAWGTLSARFEETTLAQEYQNSRSQGRGYYIRIAAAIAHDRWFGVGPNNWSYWVSNKYGPKLGWKFVHYSGTDKEPSTIVPEGSHIDEAQAAPAHSLGALTVGEMGLGGLVVFGLLWVRWFQMGAGFLWPRSPDPTHRLGVGLFFGTCGIFIQSLTEWVYRQSPIFFTFNIMIGTLAALHFLKKHSRRPESAADELGPDAPLPMAPAHQESW